MSSDPPNPASTPAPPENHLARVEEIFLAALEVDPRTWPALLNEKCGGNGDASLRREVEELLESHRAQPGQGGDLLATLNAPGRGLLDNFGAEPLRLEEPSLPADRTIGSYTVLGILGTGGMGVVYLAEQNSPRRTVALKLLRRTDPTEPQLRRFEFESEVLGRLQHPGIAQIYEAGTAKTPEGVRPFIAMELVRGKPLTDYCEDARLETHARLALVAKIADAIHHAHLRGVIHRDLKPANILVEDGVTDTRPAHATTTHAHSHDTDSPHEPSPKILDFGIARAVGVGGAGDAVAASMNTGAGQFLGTLAYMSPEQVESDRYDADARTDVYALGVMLYQLLAGKLPHDPTGRSLAEMARVIRDDEPARLGTIDRAFRGDIETIVGRAMAKDPIRRYQSAADLAEDLRRCNDGLPILSRHDSAMYVLKKQMWRYRWVVGGVAAFIVGLTAAGIIAMVQAARAEEAAADARRASANSDRSLNVALGERQAADEARARADKAVADLAKQLSASNIERGRLHANAGSLRLAEDLIWPAALREPGSRHAHWALWETYCRNPCVGVLQATRRGVGNVAFSPSGNVAAVCDGQMLVFIDAATARAIATLDGGVASTNACEFVDEQTLLVCGSDGTARLFHAPWTEAGSTATTLDFHGAADVVMASCDVAGLIVRGDNTGRLTLWRRGQTEPVELPGVSGRIRGLSFNRDGTRLLVAADAARALLLSLPGGETLATIKLPGGMPYAVSLAPDASRFVVSSLDRTARLMDLDGKVLAVINSDATPIPDVEWLVDGSAFMLAGWFSVDIWSADGKTKLRSLVAHTGETARVAASPGGKYLLTSDTHGVVRIWETAPNTARTALRPGVGRLLEAAWTPDGRAIAVVGTDPLVRLVDRASGEVRKFEGLASEGQTVDISRDGAMVAAGDKTGLLLIWNRATGERLARIESPATERIGNSVTSLRFLPDGAVLASNLDRYLRVFEPDGRLRHTFDRLSAVPGSVAISPSGEFAAIAPESTDSIRLLDLKHNESLGNIQLGARPWVVAFSPDSRTVAVGNWDGSVTLVDAIARKPVASFKGHDRLVSGVAFSPDGLLVAACSYDGSVKLYDVADHRVLATLVGHVGVTRSVAFSPDGSLIAASGDDGVLAVWDLGYYDRHIEGNRPVSPVAP